MPKKACTVCLERLLKLRQSGERTFKDAEIQELVYHSRCVGCQPKSGGVFTCRACTEFGGGARPTTIVTYGRVRPDPRHLRNQLAVGRDRESAREPVQRARERLAREKEQRARDAARAVEEDQKAQQARARQRKQDEEYRAQLKKNPRGILRG